MQRTSYVPSIDTFTNRCCRIPNFVTMGWAGLVENGTTQVVANTIWAYAAKAAAPQLLAPIEARLDWLV